MITKLHLDHKILASVMKLLDDYADDYAMEPYVKDVKTFRGVIEQIVNDAERVQKSKKL